jgi:hypothetical protein
VLAWQALTVHVNYQGNWTGLFRIGSQTKLPAALSQGVIAPGGKLLYEKTGDVDILELRRVILGNLPDPDYIGHCAYWAAK